MDSSQNANSSAWGGFLKKAMEGVEQQLDRVLENPPPKAREPAAVAAAKKDGVVPVQSKGAAGRMTLQERLAASVAKSRSGSPKIVTSNEDAGISPARSSGDLIKTESNGLSNGNGLRSPVQTETPKLPMSPVQNETPALEVKEIPSRTETPDLQAISADEPSQQATEVKESIPEAPAMSTEQTISDPSSGRTSSVRLSTTLPPDTDPSTADLISQLRSDLAACESRRIEESEQASSRISSLQQKLRILSQTTLETSKEQASNPNATSWERKLADREEKIALLLDEGEKLAKIELNLMTTIKSLRTKQKEDATTTTAALSRAEKADKQLADLKSQLKRANEIEKKNTERLKGMYKIEAANEALRKEKENAQTTIVVLQNALADAVTRADDAVSQLQTEALEKEKLVNTELREKLERLSTEFSLAEDRTKSEISDLKGRLEREQLSAKALQADLTSEISTLESKLEVLRSREEESSTSATSTAQAKLLRQIEMLQTQHTIASQNWQRIEGSLQHRNDSLEKEKNDLTKKWEEEKKKVKDTIDSKRAIQTQLDDLKREIKHLENEILKSQSHSQSLQETIQTLETRLTDQQTTFTKEKQSLLDSIDQRLKEEKQKWEEEQQVPLTPPPISAIFPSAQLMFSPVGSRPLPRNPKSVSPQPPDIKPPRAPFPQRTTSYGEISHLRRSSRGHFVYPLESSSPASSTPNLPIVTTLEDDDEREFLSHSRGDSPKNTVIDAVSLSASTSAAGPSVNIIERMSAAVRRLESDLASTKEEMSRAIKQRDEARNECIKLMSEVEEKRRFQNAVQQSQSRYEDLENRYNEALVLLGEKSERVEELQMDIVDLKEGYQHALQRLVEGK